MKVMNLIVALLFTMSLGFTVNPMDSYAKSEKKETATTTTKKVDKAKSVSKPSTLKAKSIGINSADKATLTKLPGVGPKTADAILKYRKTNGKFKSIDDLMSVKGIGEKTLKKIKPFLKL